jgi:uncharacterized membrane protein YgcG
MSATLTSLALDRGALPVVDCLSCHARSLVYLDVSGDTDVQRCLSCHAAIDLAVAPVQKAGERTIERMGYVFLDRARKSKAAQKLSGCGAKGVKSCGTGGCSSGSCGTGGGCSSGGCGSK